MSASPDQFDVVIIGGGMVGASLALALPENLEIAVVESFSLPEGEQGYQPSFDARATAISKSTEHFFKAAGIWEKISKFSEPINDVHVSDKGQWGSVLLSDKAEGLEALGFVIENACLGKALISELRARDNIALVCPATVRSVAIQSSAVKLELEQDGEAVYLHGQLAIVADGAKSVICKKLGVEVDVNRYDQMALIANVATSSPHGGIAYERFTDCGPMALLPLVATGDFEYRSALVWTLPTKQAEELLQARDEEFLRQLQNRFGDKQGEFIFVGKRFSYPLALSSSVEQVRDRVVVLGNAAHSLHPVAGQGFNLAIRDIAVLVRVLSEAIAKEEKYYSLAVLQKYVQWQKRDQWLTMAFSDLLPQVFSSRTFSLRLARGLGLLGLELVPALKSDFVNFATGFRKHSGLGRAGNLV